MELGNSTVSGRGTTVGVGLAADIAAGLAGMLVSDPCDPCSMWAACCGGEGVGESNWAGPAEGPV